MKINIKRIYFLVIIIIFLYSYLANVEKYVPIEELDIPVGIGYELKEWSPKGQVYNVPLAIYNLGQGEKQPVSVVILNGEGETIGRTREDRQRKSARKFIIGTEKIAIISQEFGEKGIHDIVNILFTNSLVNDKSLVAIFKGKATEALNLIVIGYPSSADYIQGMLQNSINFNFFSNDFQLIDIYIRIDAEGRELVLPNIDIDKNQLKIIGLSVFDKDKIVTTLNINDSKWMSILRNNKVNGVIELQDKSGNSTELYAHSKRKVKCKKVGDKYSFTIDLMIKSDIIQNEIYSKALEDPRAIKELEEDAKEEVEKMCNNFIKKMQEEIKIDCLELGREAVAKYGRKTGIDWNKAICEADIKVNVKLTIDRIGRGRY
ncbi:MAG: Ger(x)C family spore germination protein [Clostridium sp.]|nr:Ger(x)C family spore germination protein [Clostridium sp.]